MKKFLIPAEPTADPPKPIKRRQWKRTTVELNGRFEPGYRHDMAGLLMQSYSEIGSFPHSYHINGMPCWTNVHQQNRNIPSPFIGLPATGISGLDFDNNGRYLASVTKSGCLTIHDFEALYCRSSTTSSPCFLPEIETKNLMHLYLAKQLDAVRWNISNQCEIACTSSTHGGIPLFNVEHFSSMPVEILRAMHSSTIYGLDILIGFSDISFTSNDSSRVFASDTHGRIHVWDRRASTISCLLLTNNSSDLLSSIELRTENQIIFGAGMHGGKIYIWDIRGGNTSTGRERLRPEFNSPFRAITLATEQEKTGSLKAQSEIVPRKIHWIGSDPCCPSQLAFHLDGGWSGVLDVCHLCMTHLHCPAPQLELKTPCYMYDMRKACWLPTCSIYVVGSANEDGVHLLDFFPDASSPSHVDYDEDKSKSNGRRKQNQFVSLSEEVTTCAAHPLNGTIIAGSKNASLLVLSQSHGRCDDS